MRVLILVATMCPLSAHADKRLDDIRSLYTKEAMGCARSRDGLAKVVEFERWNDAWNKLRDSGKWKDAPDYGKTATGPIVLQDHGSAFWFRNVKLKPLP